MKKLLIVAMILPSLCGCTEMVPPSWQETLNNLDPTRTSDSSGDSSHVGTATVEGGAAGGLAGFALAKLTGSDSKETVVYTLSGAAIGGLASNWYAKRQLEASKKLQEEEDDLDAQIEYAKYAVDDAQEYNKNLKIQIDQTRDHIKKVQLQMKEKEITQAKLEEENLKLEEIIKTAEENEMIMSAQVEEIKAYRAEQGNGSGQNLAEMDEKIAKLEQSLIVAKERTRELASMKI